MFWLSTQPWFDLLPRRVTRRSGYGGLVILTGAALLAPTALQAGLERWIDYATAQERYTDFVDGAFDHLDTPQLPTPAPTPSQ